MADNFSYRTGHCAQCDKAIMVRDANRKYTAIRAIYRQVKIVFKNGHSVRVPVCNVCNNGINYGKIIDSVCGNGSMAFSSEVKKSAFRALADASANRHSVVEVIVPKNQFMERREKEYDSRS